MEEFEQLTNNSNNVDFDTYNKASIQNYRDSVSDDNIKYFINEDEKLNVVVDLEIPADRGTFAVVITIE